MRKSIKRIFSTVLSDEVVVEFLFRMYTHDINTFRHMLHTCCYAAAIAEQCCEYNDHADYPYVSIDDTRAAELATEYLLSNGGSKIALINGPGNFKYARRRQEGFMNALRNAEVMIPKQWIVQLPEVSYEMAYAAICRLLNSDSRPNAFFTISISDSFKDRAAVLFCPWEP